MKIWNWSFVISKPQSFTGDLPGSQHVAPIPCQRGPSGSSHDDIWRNHHPAPGYEHLGQGTHFKTMLIIFWRKKSHFWNLFLRWERPFVVLVIIWSSMTGRGQTAGLIGGVGVASIHTTRLGWGPTRCWQIATSSTKGGLCLCGILQNEEKLSSKSWMPAASRQIVSTKRTLCPPKLLQNGTNFSVTFAFKITKGTRNTSGKLVKSVR